MDIRIRPGIKVSKRNLFRKGEHTRDQAISYLAAYIKEELKKKKSFNQISFSEEPEIQELLLYALNKPEKSRDDFIFIAHYLSTFGKLMDMLSSKKSMNESKETLLLLAKKMEFENHPTSKVICHHSDPGYKYYLILKGSIGIIIHQDVKVQMCYDDYYNHLLNLKEKKEYVLLRAILRKNQHVWDEFEMSKNLGLDEEIEQIEMKKRMNSEEYISKEEYVKLSNYKITPPDYKTIHPITLIIYVNVVDSKAGNTFGDIALSSDNNKRTATVICAEECILASLTKESYDKIVKDVQDKLRKANIGVILELPLFQGIKVLGFIKKYFNHFYEKVITKGTPLFSQGDERTDLFFLKGGEIELATYASFNDLTTLIKLNDGEIDVHKEKSMFQELTFNKVNISIKRKKNYKLFVYKEREIIGLDDLYHDKKYIASAICLSQTVALYAINYETFQQIISEEVRMTGNYKKVIRLKKKMLIERLTKFRSAELASKYNLCSTERFNLIPSSSSPSIFLNPQITLDQIPQYKMKGTSKYPFDDTSKDNTRCNQVIKKEMIFLMKGHADRKKFINLNFSSDQPTIIHDNDNLKDNCFSTKITKPCVNSNPNKCFITGKNYETGLNSSLGKSDTNNTKNSNYGTIENTIIKKDMKIKIKKLKGSASCGMLDTQMISKDMIERIIKITKKEKQRSKQLVAIERQSSPLNSLEEELFNQPFYPSTIDFLAMDKVYESIEVKKGKKSYILKSHINPYNLSLSKRPKLPKIEKRSSLIFL